MDAAIRHVEPYVGWWAIWIGCGIGVWFLVVRWNRRRVRAADGSGDAREGVVVFVEPVRWLFVVWGFASFVRGLRRGGCEHQVRLFRWSGRAGALLVLPDLMRRGRLLVKARRLARFVTEIRTAHPGVPIHVCGYSSGAYVALEAIKRLDRCVVDTVVLLACSVSPRYGLEAVVERVGTVHNFHSVGDVVINGLGPLLLGGNDRGWALAAGMVGFAAPPPGVVQHGWSVGDVQLGYCGDHFTVTASRFVARRVAPVLRGASRSGKPDGGIVSQSAAMRRLRGT